MFPSLFDNIQHVGWNSIRMNIFDLFHWFLLCTEDDKSPYNYIDAKIDFEPSMDIAEIDARLNALQKFMKSNMKDL